MRPLVLFISWSLLPEIAAAQSDSVVYTLPEVLIQEDARERAAAVLSASTTSIDSIDVRLTRGYSVDRAIRRNGLAAVRDRGGESAVKTVSIRAFGATQTYVDWNGIRLNSDQNGHADLGLIAASCVTSALVTRGSQSTTYGSGAMGGSVHLRSLIGMDDPLRLEARAGSFGLAGGLIEAGPSSLKFPVSLQVGFERSANNFEFAKQEGGTERTHRRELNGSSRAFAALSGVMILEESWNLKPSVLLTDVVRRSPGPVTNSSPSNATLYDRLLLAGVVAERILEDRATTIGVSFLGHDERYAEASATPPVDETYRNRGAAIWLERAMALDASHSISGVVEIRRSSVKARIIRPDAERSTAALSLSSINEFLSGRVVLGPAVRLEASSSERRSVTGKVSLRLQALPERSLTFRFGFGSSFRYPTYNEKYWTPGGNPDLLPEQSTTIEGGVEGVASVLGSHRWSIMAYAAHVRNQIVGWPAQNVNRTRLTGGEAQWVWTVSGHVTFRGGVALTRAESLIPSHPGSQLPFIPILAGSAGSDVRIWGILVRLDMEYASRRYTTVDNIAPLSSEPYLVASSGIIFPAGSLVDGLSVTVLADNIFNRRYELVKEYPMPGRSLTLSLSLEVQ